MGTDTTTLLIATVADTPSERRVWYDQLREITELPEPEQATSRDVA